jgi:ubiquinone/menaquinone biosynthesis C-methylase UbiE
MKNTGLADESLDVVVFSQSLNAVNWSEYLTEAKRCLCTNGIIMIGETTKQIKERLSTLMDELIKLGFDINKDEQKGEFTFIEARKL